eukprot:UN10450
MKNNHDRKWKSIKNVEMLYSS